MSSVTVKVILEPSDALALLMVTAALSSLLIVPVPVSVAVMPDFEVLKPTVKVSLASNTASSMVDTEKVLVSPFVPLKESAVVLAV